MNEEKCEVTIKFQDGEDCKCVTKREAKGLGEAMGHALGDSSHGLLYLTLAEAAESLIEYGSVDVPPTERIARAHKVFEAASQEVVESWGAFDRNEKS